MTSRMARVVLIAFLTLAAFAATAAAQGVIAVEIKGRITNELTEEQYQAVEIIVSDRLMGVELDRTRPNKRGRYELKVNAPKYIIIKALLEGHPTALYQLDTKEYAESTGDRAENRAFGAMRIQTYYQNVTFGETESAAAESDGLLALDDLLAQEDPQAVKAYRKARDQKDAGNVAKAVDSFEKLIKKYPSFYIGYIDLGMIQVAQQQPDRAQETFTHAQTLRPEHPWAYVGLGLALNQKGDHQGSVGPLERAVELDQNSINAQFQLGQASFQFGDKDRALECFQRVVELDPKFNPIVYKLLSSIYVNRQDAVRAADSLESYLTHFPDAADRDKVEQILVKLKR